MSEGSVVTAGELMTRDVAVTRPESWLMEAAMPMARRNIGGLPVVDAVGAIVGILTEGDLVRWHEGHSEKQARWLEMLAEGGDLASTFLESIRDQRHNVNAVMSRGVITAGEDTSARQIAILMMSKGIRRVPVMRDGKLVGIVARSDLVRASAERPDAMERVPQAEAPARSIDEALKRRREETVPRRRG